MLAECKNVDVFDDDELVMILVKDCIIDNVTQVFLVSLCKEHHGLGIALRRAVQALALRIFAKAFKDGTNCAGKLLMTILRFFCRCIESGTCAYTCHDCQNDCLGEIFLLTWPAKPVEVDSMSLENRTSTPAGAIGRRV